MSKRSLANKKESCKLFHIEFRYKNKNDYSEFNC